MTEIAIDLPETFNGPRHRQRVARLVADRAPGWVLTRIDTEDRKAYAAPLLPGKSRGTTPPTTKPSDLAVLDASLERRGLALVGADLAHRQVTLAKLTPQQQEVRRRVAMRLGCQPWEIELAVGGRGTGDVTDVVVTRWPAAGVPAATARELWLEVAREVVGHRGWTRRISGGHVEMHMEPMPEFPSRTVPWDLIAEQPWNKMFLGFDGRGRPVWADFLATPMAMVTGRTGAGKSVALMVMLGGLLLRGWDLRLAEPVKSGLDFGHLRPFFTRWGTTRAEVAALMTELVTEVGKRKSLMLRHGSKKWSELPKSVREEHDIRPILVIHDELENATKEIATKGFTGTLKEEAEEEAAAVSTTRALIGKFLREARFVGIHLMLSTQIWNVADLGPGSGSWRSNCGLKIALGRLTTGTLEMSVTNKESCRIAYERAFGSIVEGEDDDPTGEDTQGIKGLGLAELDYTEPAAMRVPWPGEDHEIVGLLRSRGVAEPGGPPPADPDQEEGYGPPPNWNATEPVPEVPEVSVPDVTDLGELDLDLDLTDLEPEPVDEKTLATTEPAPAKPGFDFGKFKL